MSKLTWIVAVAGLSLIAAEGTSLAQPGPPGKGPGWRQGKGGGGGPGWRRGWRRGWRKGRRGGGPKMRCTRMLMKAHADVLKSKLGLSDAQVKRIQTLRVNFWKKQIQLRATIQQHQLSVRLLMQKDLPAQGKVLAAMRKARGARGKLQEERVKTGLKMLGVLNKQQRQKLRAQQGPGQGRWGRGGRGGRGGRRWGGRGGGW